MIEAYICDAVRTPIGRFGGALSSVRSDDLATIPIAALLRRNPQVDPREVLYPRKISAGFLVKGGAL